MSFFGRRTFMVLAGSLGIGVVASTPRKAFSSSGKGQCLSLEDQRVKRFTAYREMAFQDPAKAVETYSSPNLSYASTSGQEFNKPQLIERIKQWNEGFRRNAVKPVVATELEDGSILIVYDQNILNSGDFRGASASNNTLDLTSLFKVSFDDKGMISSYSSYQDYGHLAKNIGSANSVQLLGLR
ncbi:hypothetical protein [Synechococcus sp. BIOS-E4-1]|uniref:hypothetical protein n=1 Tax=Synechococcus sp. BIOS-E4-1 TaxID=1400864 RepID=UPI00164509CD|nr:hypothetical protein [Synechococcus sp. BIOS-E4-1]